MSQALPDSLTGPALYSFKKNGQAEWMLSGDFWVTASAQAAQRGFSNGAASVWKGYLGNKAQLQVLEVYL